MSAMHRPVMACALGFAAALLLAGADRAPSQAADDAAGLKDRLSSLEQKVNSLSTRVDELRAELRKTKGGDEKQTAQKIAALERQVQGLTTHTHEYLQEGRAGDGSVQAVRSDEFTSRGLTATGSIRIGRPVIGR